MEGFRVSSWRSCGAFGRHSEAPYCTTSFSRRFSPWSLSRNGGWAGKRDGVTSSHLFDDVRQVIEFATSRWYSCFSSPSRGLSSPSRH